MLYIDGNGFQVKIFSYIADSVILCEVIGETQAHMEEVLRDPKEIKYKNADDFITDYSYLRLQGFMGGADEGNVRMLLK